MENEARVEMYINQGRLVVPIQVELTDGLALQVQKDILDELERTGLKGVVIDLSGVSIIDLFLAKAIFDTGRMASLLGAKTVITGLKPGVVASLIDLDFDPGYVSTAMSLDDGFQLLTPPAEPQEERMEEDEEPEVEIYQVEEQTDKVEEIGEEENGKGE